MLLVVRHDQRLAGQTPACWQNEWLSGVWRGRSNWARGAPCTQEKLPILIDEGYERHRHPEHSSPTRRKKLIERLLPARRVEQCGLPQRPQARIFENVRPLFLLECAKPPRDSIRTATAAPLYHGLTHQNAKYLDSFLSRNRDQRKAPETFRFIRGLAMGPIRFERTTSSLSGTRSNQLSYEPGTVRRWRRADGEF